MIVLLSVLVLLTAAGFAAVVWASRGGPRWVHGVARVVLVVAELVTMAKPLKGRSGSNSGD
ncbi:hypothetical protein ACGFSB_09705 [Streptomyces sp. NPDC048441]|uniref:hypothetical protein n=1 Tax=Streptomyces sp. NPDC048441 TaxID=3365552 RepID=UPI003714A0F9